jgi:phage tail sheath protein FI
MPVTLSYPGVYIEEVPSGVRTITGVATSITAFVGNSSRGPDNEPVEINNFGDYERNFGGLQADSMMSYAVRDFYLNGGSKALIVRIHNGATRATIPLPTENGVDTLILEAQTVGAWGNNLEVGVDYGDNNQLQATDLFNIRVFERVNGIDVAQESFLNLSTDPNAARFVGRVLAQESILVRTSVDVNGDPVVPASRPLDTVAPTSPPTSPPTTVLSRIRATPGSGSDGGTLTDAEYRGSRSQQTGIFALEQADLFNLLCIPPPARDGDTDLSVWQTALPYCVERRAMLIVDPPRVWGANPLTAVSNARDGVNGSGPAPLQLSGTDARNAALFFPRVKEADPMLENQTQIFVPCGIIAGVMARTDASRGVWKAPAGLDASLNGTQGVQINLTDEQNGSLNPIAINCLRQFPVHGRVVWGSRTMRGSDQSADEYKYIPVRRLALFLEESLYRGTQWVVFEPNDEPLWSQIRLNIGAFMQNLFRQGAFQGKTPREAYLVKCDAETTTPYDQQRGVVNIVVGFAPLKPAEFVVIRIQQLAGQTQQA